MNRGELWHCVNHIHRRTEPILISALPLTHPQGSGENAGIDGSKV